MGTPFPFCSTNAPERRAFGGEDVPKFLEKRRDNEAEALLIVPGLHHSALHVGIPRSDGVTRCLGRPLRQQGSKTCTKWCLGN